MFGFNEPFESVGLCLFAKLRTFSSISISNTFSFLWSFWNFPTLPFQSLGQKAGALQGLCLPPGPKGGRTDGDKKGSPPSRQQLLSGCRVLSPAGSHRCCCSCYNYLGLRQALENGREKRIGNFSYSFWPLAVFFPTFWPQGFWRSPSPALMPTHGFQISINSGQSGHTRGRKNGQVRPFWWHFESWSSFSKLLLDDLLFRAQR